MYPTFYMHFFSFSFKTTPEVSIIISTYTFIRVKMDTRKIKKYMEDHTAYKWGKRN